MCIPHTRASSPIFSIISRTVNEWNGGAVCVPHTLGPVVFSGEILTGCLVPVLISLPVK